jgi:hypothetical protein
MKIRRSIVALLISTILLTGCARQQSTTTTEAGPAGDTKVTGNLSVKGKAEALKHVYTRRVEATPEGKQAAIEVLLVNQALSEALVDKIFADEENRFMNSDNILKDTTIHALYLNIPKNQYKKDIVNYDATLITPRDSFQQGDDTKFSEFDLKKGVLTAKTDSQWDDSFFNDKFHEVKVKCSYSVDFQAVLQAPAGQPVGADPPATQIPAEGTANGKMTYEGETVALKYAYAKRFKLFFDEPEDYMIVLLTDKTIPEPSRLEIFEKNGWLYSKYKLQGMVLMIDQFGRINGGGVESKSDALSTNLFTPKQCALENGRIKGQTSYDKERRMSKDERDFSVTFDAPLAY